MQSKAATVEQYLASLPEDRRTALAAVRQVILDNLDADYQEGMQYGMIGYAVPHSVFPAGYHCDPRQPLPFAGLASQKQYMSLYMMCVYDAGMENAHATWFRQAWAKTGKKLDMGKACIRFKNLDDLPLEVIGQAIRRMPARKWIAIYEASRQAMANRTTKGPPKKAKASKKSPSKKKPVLATKPKSKKPAR